jgi:hypothetical protein
MNQIEFLRSVVSSRIPDAKFSVDRPALPEGSWWLDAELDGHLATVQWKPGRGFGISASPASGFGEGPDEIYSDVESAAARMIELLERHEQAKSETIGRGERI